MSEDYAQSIIDDLREELNEALDVLADYRKAYTRVVDDLIRAEDTITSLTANNNDLQDLERMANREVDTLRAEITRLQTIIDKFEATIEAESGL